MLKKKISIASLCIIMMLGVGCQSKEEQEKLEDLENEETYEQYQMPEEPTASDIIKNYDNVDKEKLDYTCDEEGDFYLYEYKGGLAYGGNEKYHPNVSGKKYKRILNKFEFQSEVYPINTSYESAVELTKKVLPDDVKEVSQSQYLEMGGDGIGCTITYYESSVGNIGVSFVHPYGEDGNYDKNTVAGIGYMIEIME